MFRSRIPANDGKRDGAALVVRAALCARLRRHDELTADCVNDVCLSARNNNNNNNKSPNHEAKLTGDELDALQRGVAGDGAELHRQRAERQRLT
jgi:hypothetical protein